MAFILSVKDTVGEYGTELQPITRVSAIDCMAGNKFSLFPRIGYPCNCESCYEDGCYGYNLHDDSLKNRTSPRRNQIVISIPINVATCSQFFLSEKLAVFERFKSDGRGGEERNRPPYFTSPSALRGTVASSFPRHLQSLLLRKR